MLLHILVFCFNNQTSAQLIINEGSNRNFSIVSDEDNDHPDWIELWNNSADSVRLQHYTLTDDIAIPGKWEFPAISIAPYAFMKIFCSGKDRKPVSRFQQVLNTGSFTPLTGWNEHVFNQPFYWDGIANIMINTCSYSSQGYTVNSTFNQTTTGFRSTLFSFVDNSADACGHQNGNPVYQRPNIKLNGHVIGTGTINNSPYDYPAPYGNWYWSARNQMLFRAAELQAAGITAGWINSLAFDVVGTDPSTVYSYIDISMKQVNENEMSGTFQPLNATMNLHTNFSISGSGETVYLFDATGVLKSQLKIDCINVNNSKGCSPDGNSNIVFFSNPTPEGSNNTSFVYHQYLQQPQFSKASGSYAGNISVSITNSNTIPSSIRYTLDGSDPVPNSDLYTGTPIAINASKVLKARAFADTVLPSPLKAASYLIGISHTTPVLSVITDNSNLYGSNGIFDNWDKDWEKTAYAEYFNTDRSLVFSQDAGIQMDGGAGGSRSNPQHSFRLELNNPVIGGGTVNYPLLPDKPGRTHYSKIYLRNGSNQYLRIPYKDACGVKVLCDETHNYYSAYRPVSVYINGDYFGLYELREKFDEEFFKEADDADSIELLSQSYWYGSVLRSITGSVDSFYNARSAFEQINPADVNFWEKADCYFDMEYYNDYIIAEAFIHNKDWPYNNIKIYRSNKTGHRYRYAIQDVELSLNPFGWSTSDDDPIAFLYGQNANDPFLNVWLKGIQNPRFKNYFINRFADVLNTAYLPQRLTEKESAIYNEIVREMPKEYARWGDPNNIPQQMNEFRDNHLTLKSEYACRGQKVRNFIQNGFQLQDQVEVTLDVYPAGAGKIKISTITPDSLPWKGIYFHGNPVTITAIANPGFTFSHWDANAMLNQIDTAIALHLDIRSSTLFKANFLETPFGLPASHNNDGHFVLYPNPGKGRFSLFLNDLDNGDYDVTIHNAWGQLVQQNKVTVNNRKGIVSPDLTKMPGGIYFVSIIHPSFKKTLRFINIKQ